MHPQDHGDNIKNLRRPTPLPLSATERAEQKFRILVESISDYAIFLLDPNGIIESWNIGAQRCKGYEASEIIGRHFSIFYTSEDLARSHPENELKIAREVGRYEEEGWRVRKDGTRFWANVVITALHENGKLLGFSKVTRDVTDKRQAEEKLKLALDHLERRVSERTKALSESNQKLKEAVQVRDDFLSIASHELRTPLTPLKLQIESMVHQIRNKRLFTLPENRVVKIAQTCEKSINRLSGLIDNLLDVSRIHSGKLQLNLEETDLMLLTREVIERYQSSIHLSGSVVKLDGPATIFGMFDRLRMEQVITNLLSNALKYGDGKPIYFILKEENDKCTVVVKDQGVGISKSDCARIFERFERGSSGENIGGLGLGLYISRQIIQAHGGKIHVESEEGDGARFIARLPLHRISLANKL